jgi:NTE family protein
MPTSRPRKKRVAFVLGGGGQLGASQVGMLRALLERDLRPDLIVGTSIGAINGVAVAADPTVEGVDRLEGVWTNLEKSQVFSGSLLSGAANLVRTRTHLHSPRPLRQLLERTLPVRRFEDLAVPFQCVAASIERAAEHWFDRGPLIDPILASAAVPGLLPPVEIDGEHYLDGGLVNSVPIGRAVQLGATEVYVLHVGRIDRPLGPPRNVWQVGLIAFEIARRHRFASDMAAIPEGVIAHVLPTGDPRPPRYDDVRQLRYRGFTTVAQRIAHAHRATSKYLDRLPKQGTV